MTIDATMNPASVRLFEQGTVDSLSPIELAGLLADDTAIFDGDEIIIQEPAPVGRSLKSLHSPSHPTVRPWRQRLLRQMPCLSIRGQRPQ
jgi:hypothetical protein